MFMRLVVAFVGLMDPTGEPRTPSRTTQTALVTPKKASMDVVKAFMALVNVVHEPRRRDW